MKKSSQYILSIATVIVSGFLAEIRNKEMYGFILMLIFLLYSLAVNKRNRNIIYITAALPVLIYIAFRITDGFRIYNSLINTALSIYAVWLSTGYLSGFFLIKWKIIQSNFNLILLTVIAFVLALLPGGFDQIFQFFAVGIIYLIAPYIAFRSGASQKWIPWIIVLPFILLYGVSILVNRASPLYPTAIISVCSVLIYTIVSKINLSVIKLLILILYIIFLGYAWYAGLESYERLLLCCVPLSHSFYSSFL